MEASAIHRHQNIRKLKGFFYIENRTLRFKAFYLVFFFGCGTLRNYLPVYFRHVGLNAVLTGVITGVRPFTGFISAPFFSFLADKTGCYKLILLLSLVLSVLSYFSLSFVAFVRQAKEAQSLEHFSANITFLERNSIKLPQSLSLSGKTPPFTKRDRGFAFGGNHHGNAVLNYSFYQRRIKNINIAITQMGKNKTYSASTVTKSSGKYREHGRQFPDSVLYYSNQSLVHLNVTSTLSETTIFFTSLILVILGDVFNAPVGAIMCSTILYWEGSSQFGKQRVFGAIGFGLGSFLTGIAIDKTVGYNYFRPSLQHNHDSGLNEPNPNYLTSFFLYLGVNGILLMIVSCGFDISRESKSKILMVHIKKILSRGVVVCFLVYVFIMGVVGGTIMLFLFWFLENLGASQSLLGLSSAIMSISEVPIFPLCAKMINAIGHVGVLCLSLTCSVIRLTCYTFLQDPWYVLFIEPLHGITLAAMWSTSISFASAISTPEVYTTMEGVISGFHYGLGWGLGAVIGGTFYNLYGPRNLFRGCILLCCIGYIFLGLVYILNRKDHSSLRYDKLDNDGRGSVNVNTEYEIIPGDTY